MIKLKFKTRPAMPCFDGPGGHWNPGQVKEVPDDMAVRLLELNRSPFSIAEDVKPEEKAFHAPEDKMLRGAPENKATNEFEQLFTGGALQPKKEAAKEKVIEDTPEPEPSQERGESNSQFKRRLKKWRREHSKE